MSKHGHMPPVPPANHSQKGPGDHSEAPSNKSLKHAEVNPSEQGQTANLRQTRQTRVTSRGAVSNSSYTFHAT